MTLAAEILADNPAAYWKHPGGSTTDADQSGNGRNLTWTAAPTGVSFVESNGVILAADREASRADEAWMHATTWTLEWWHQSSAAAIGTGIFAVVSRRATVDRWAVYIRRATGDIQLLVYPGGVSVFSTATDLLDGYIHHCVVQVIYNGTNTSYAFFVDGEPAGSGALISGSISTGAESWRSWGENGSRRFFGQVAHTAFYPAQLSSGRIAAHFAQVPISISEGWTVGLRWSNPMLPRGSTWKYKQITLSDITDYSAPSYDDSAWSSGQAPFGSIRSGGVVTYPYPSHFDLESRLWTRYHLTLPSITSALFISGIADNQIEVWWNGYKIGDLTIASGGEFSFVVPVTVQTAGTNVIACRTSDDAFVGDPDGAVFDAEVKRKISGWQIAQ